MILFKNCIVRIFFVSYISIVFTLITTIIFSPIFTSNEIIIFFAMNPFNICNRFPLFWEIFKKIYIVLSIISFFIICNSCYSFLSLLYKKLKKFSPKVTKINLNKNDEISLYIGKNSQNFLVNSPLLRIISEFTCYWFYWVWKNFFFTISFD